MKRFSLLLFLLPIAAYAQFSNAKSIWSRPIAPTAPNDGECLIYSLGTLKWIPGACATGVSGITSLNGLTGATQTFATPGTTGTAPNWVSSGTAHTLHIPLASAAGVTAGLVTKAWWDTVATSANNLSFFAATTSAQLLALITNPTGTGVLVFGTSPTIATPTIASFANANHDHSNSAGGGQIGSTAFASGSKNGNGTKFQMFTGSAPATDDCAKFDANANLVSAGGACGTSGGGSVFTGSTASAPSFSATPTFSLADVSVKSPVRFEPGALTANVTSVTFSNKSAGAKFSIAWLQDGTGGRTVAYGASASNTCAISTTASITTTQMFEVKADGSTVVGTGCTTDDSGLIFTGPTMAAPGTPATSSATIYVDSTSKNIAVKDDAGVVKHGVQTKAAVTNNFATAISDAGVVSVAQPTDADLSTSDITTNNASTSKHGFIKKLSNSATDYMDGTGNWSVPPGGSGFAGSPILPKTATYQVLAADFSNYKTITVASGTFTITLVDTATQPSNGQYITVVNYGSGNVTVARSGQNINGGTASLSLPVGSAISPSNTTIWSDGTNYFATQPVSAINSPSSGRLAVWAGGNSLQGTDLTGDVTTSGTAATIAANAVSSSKMAVVNTRRSCDMGFGNTNGSALANGDLGPQKGVCFIPFAATVVEVDVIADGGTPNVIVGVNHAGSVSNLVSSALATAGSGGRACSKTSAIAGLDGTTCSATLQNTSVAVGDYIEAVSGTAGGTAKWMSVHVVYLVN